MDEKLRKILNELADEDREGSDDEGSTTSQSFIRLGELMPRFTAPEPTSLHTTALIDKLLPLLDNKHVDVEQGVNARTPRFAEVMDREGRGHSGTTVSRLFRLMMPQLLILSPWFWVGSLLAVGISLMLMLSPQQPFGFAGSTNPIVLMAPLLSLLGISYSCRSYGTPMFELEMSFPLTPSQWLTGKIAMILCCYLILFALASGVLAWNEGIAIIPFTISWLIPLCLYSLLTLALMLRFGTLTATFTMVGFWLMQFIFGEGMGAFYFLGDTSFEQWLSSKVVGAIVSVVVAAYVIFRLRRDQGIAVSATQTESWRI
ncbi:hypothetical protein [Cohnella sp. WQ 127256]|uniref:hypothetical protein n=1 Tax=Cohnella sp. WQ 127256 TaxID=2938790 RepID=UPI0021198D30|nr:hypothetical protein [Cohnella sp. WQ 127256]